MLWRVIEERKAGTPLVGPSQSFYPVKDLMRGMNLSFRETDLPYSMDRLRAPSNNSERQFHSSCQGSIVTVFRLFAYDQELVAEKRALCLDNEPKKARARNPTFCHAALCYTS